MLKSSGSSPTPALTNHQPHSTRLQMPLEIIFPHLPAAALARCKLLAVIGFAGSHLGDVLVVFADVSGEVLPLGTTFIYALRAVGAFPRAGVVVFVLPVYSTVVSCHPV